MKNKIFSIITKLGVAKILRTLRGDQITVLCLHRISNDFDFFFDPIKPTEFELLVKYCMKHYSIISFSNIHTTTSKPKLIFSFDDGYYDFMENAIPILSKYNLPSNHNFVNSSLNNNQVIWTQKVNDIFNYLKNSLIVDDEIINELSGNFGNNWWKYYMGFLNHLFESDSGQRDKIIDTLIKKYNIESNYRMMDWNDLKTCKEKHNVEIGSHTYNHVTFNNQTKAEVIDLEIGKSIEELENYLQEKINIVSLPNGKFNDLTMNYIQNKEIEFVLLVNDKFNKTTNLTDNFNPINRIYLIQEPSNEMILRMEGLHAKIKAI